MAYVNEHYLKLKAGYLFPEIGRRVSAFAADNPDAAIIKLGIGDVTEPLPAAIVEAMHQAVDDMAARETFHGYGPEQGYPWLREKIAEHDYRGRGCEVAADEIFVSDGSKCDTGNFLDILAAGQANKIAVCDPVYPVYVDTNVMAGNTGPANERGEYEGLVYLPMTADNGFTPAVPDFPVDVVYLCYPNNPTGATADKQTLAKWVDYAKANDALLLFDAAYHAFITEPNAPHSIYEIDGAREWLMAKTKSGERVELHKLWNRRHSTKFNGVSYIVQRGAEAAYSEAGAQQIAELVSFYMTNARIIREQMTAAGLDVYGGVNAPYVWVKTPNGMTSWEFFDRLLSQTHVVGTPGSGFGASGEGFFRISAFNSRTNVEEAMGRIAGNLKV